MTARVHYHSDCPWFAGCENMLANLLNEPAIRRQFEVSFSYRWTPAYEAGLARRTRSDFPVHPLRFPEPSSAIPSPAWLPGAVRRALRVLSRLVATYPLLLYEIWRLRALFIRLAPDVVHINNGGYPAAISARGAAIAARMAGVRHVVMVVNNLAEEARPGDALRALVDRRVVRATSRFVTGSSAAAAQLQRVLRLPAESVVAYPNGIALRARSETPEETRRRLGIVDADGVLLGVVALMEERKGHRVLVDAVARLAREGGAGAPFTVLFEGDGPLRDALTDAVRGAGLADRVRFVGHEANVMDFMAALDVLVLPSVSQEDFPNVVLEAMGLGRPVIASRLAGTPEQVDDQVTGLLVPPGDAAALAGAVRRLVGDPALRDEMGRAGHRRFEERFTAPLSVTRYAALYQSLNAEDDS